ncbi:MAG: hypothetical protein FWE11_09525 [Defluviitaleaceae bacterium]|nr:hypothetical protein [Defluviitaleaceae bacterium]
MGLGIASYGIISITKKQTEAAGEYRTNKSRYDREKRLDDFLNNDK